MRFLPLIFALGCAAGDTETDSEMDTGMEEAVVGSCAYVNSFSSAPECKEYSGENWTVEMAEADCAAPMPATEGVFGLGIPCDRDEFLGECRIDEGGADEATLIFLGSDPSGCDNLEFGCTFAGGVYYPSDTCDGAEPGDGGGGVVFTPFELVCSEPLAGEGPGNGPDGDVCTWQAISGATEEGRRFEDYADCSTVITQRPYWPAQTVNNTSPDDPRLSDPEWVREYEWVTDQVRASACICCHSDSEAPEGPSGWNVEAGPIWTDTLDDDGMAMMAGWINSEAFGRFDAADNNGFSRDVTGTPTTDPQRMQAFWVGELARLGYDQSDFVDATPFGGPLFDQLTYEPEPCADGIGVDANGVVNWQGGAARYVYVMAKNTNNPGVPPNLDLPQGTVWRLDVDHTEDAIRSGINYGAVPNTTFQSFPASGEPAALMRGETYYLYVLRDIYQPLTRCLFEAQ